MNRNKTTVRIIGTMECLSSDSLKKLSALTKEKDSFDLVFKPLKCSDSFRASYAQLKKPLKYLAKFSYIFLEPLLSKC